jgi:mono/diheme cytochrome c family protein
MDLLKSVIIIPIAVILLSACTGKSDKSTTVTSDPVVVEKPAVESVTDISDHPGKALYAQHCLVCHQLDGSGVPGMFPPLNDTKWVNGDNETLISIVIHGMNEDIEVDGVLYSSIMAPMPYLTDQEVADILNYVRKEFGSSGEEITIGEIEKVRAEGKQ